MGLRINTNIPALIAQRYVRRNFNDLSDNLTRLSSGRRIVKAGDDAAGLAISNRLRALIVGGRQAERNIERKNDRNAETTEIQKDKNKNERTNNIK